MPRYKGFVMLAVVVVVMAAGSALPAAAAGTFTDDDGNVHEANIEAIAAAGITLGCNPPDNTLYCPSDVVTRGAMAAFLVRALELPAAAMDHFTDDAGSVFEADINSLAEAEITLGCNPPDNSLYCPDDPVTRGQMAAFLVRGYGYTEDDDGDRFSDDDTSVFEADIEKLATAGITLGCNPPTNDRFCPDDPVLRDQMASFLVRAENLDPIIGSFVCTEVIGFSQTREWYLGDGAFEAAVGSARWQMRAVSGAEIQIIASPNWSGWGDLPESGCLSGPVDRAVLTISGFERPLDDWVAIITKAVGTVGANHPSLEIILLQPAVGGPDHQLCLFGGEEVRASFNHPIIDEAIAMVVASESAVDAGFSPEVRTCDDYRDSLGHLDFDAQGAIGAEIGAYYSTR